MARPMIQAMPGDRYGFLTLLYEVEPDHRPFSTSHYRKFLVRCDCGTERTVRLCNMRSGTTRSCGVCARTKRDPVHGQWTANLAS